MTSRKGKISKEMPMNAEDEVCSNTIPGPFVYEKDCKLLVFLCKSKNHSMKCPNCQIETRYIVNHLTKNSKCQKNIIIEDFKEQFTNYKSIDKNCIMKNQKERTAASRAKSREQDPEKVKKAQRVQKAASRAKLREQDPGKVKKAQGDIKAASRAN